MEQEKEAIKAKIAQLRTRYAKLRAMCGPRVISSNTIRWYADEIESLEAKLKA